MNDDIVNRLRKIAKPEQWISLAEWETAAIEAEKTQIQIPCPDGKPGCCVAHFRFDPTGKEIGQRIRAFRPCDAPL